MGYGGDTPTGQRGLPNLQYGYTELVLRVGVPFFCVGLIAQYPLTRQAFLPASGAATNHLYALPDELRDPWAYEFISAWTRPIVDLTYQDAHFRRADSFRLIVASELPAEDKEGFLRSATTQMRAELWLQIAVSLAGQELLESVRTIEIVR